MMRQMRVAQLVPSLSLGGVTQVAVQLAARLRERGVDMEIVRGPHGEPLPDMTPHAQALGIPVHVIPTFRRAPSPLKDRQAFRDLVSFFREARYDIVHAHRTKAVLLGTWAARRAGVPATIWHVHGWGFHEHYSPVMSAAMAWAHRLAARTATRIVAVSDDTRRVGLTHGIGSQDQYRVIYEAVELERFREPTMPREAAKARLGIDPGKLVVGSLMRLTKQKAPLDLIDAAAKVVEEVADVHFLIVGDGDLREATERRVHELGLDACVTLPGARNDTPDVLSACDVFALASLWEGFPICYLEAMALGVPVVGTDAGGARETVIDGETGYIVPCRDTERLAERVVSLLRDDEARSRMGEAGRRHAAAYGYDRLADAVHGLYGELLAVP